MAYGEYLIRRGRGYCFRIKVPAHLRTCINRRELRRSLSGRTYVEAKALAQRLAWVTLRLFHHIEDHMDTLSTDEIHRLLQRWHLRMLERDAEIRQEIEAGLHELTLQDHGEHCESTAEVLQSLLEVVTVPSYDGPQSDGYERQTYSKDERQKAYDEASRWVDGTGIEDDFDFLPVLEQEVRLGSLDELTRRTLIREFLWSAMETYRTKRDISAGHTRLRPRDIRTTSAGIATSTRTPKPNTHPISEAWKAYVTQQQSANKKAWMKEPPEKAQIMIRNITGLLGDIPVESLTFEDVERYQRFEQKCPRGGRNMKAEYKDKTVRELEKMDVPDGDKPSSKTVNDKLAPLRALLKMFQGSTPFPRTV